ncbi:MAG: DUF4396 domain-containing protein [Ginsengibacter sp.]
MTVGALHCGSGCTLGDIVAETLLLYITLTIVTNKLVNAWIVDYFFAFAHTFVTVTMHTGKN